MPLSDLKMFSPKRKKRIEKKIWKRKVKEFNESSEGKLALQQASLAFGEPHEPSCVVISKDDANELTCKGECND